MTKIEKMLPACGFAIAVALVVATSAFKQAPPTLHAFEYNAPVVGSVPSYSQTDVQNVNHWSYTPDQTPCDNIDDEACKIYVSDTYAEPNGSGGYEINPSSMYSITASAGSESHVTQTSDGTSTDFYSNKAE